MKSGQLYSVLYGISSLASLLVILLCIWIVSRGGNGYTSEKLKKSWESGTMPIVQPQGKRTVWISTAMLIALTIGASIGYAVRDHQLVENTRMYFGVSVISQQSDHRYMVRIPGFEKEYDWEFCHPVKMPSPLIDIKYEQRFGCKAVNGVGFVSIHQERNNVELQTRRNSAAAKSAAYARLERGR